MQKTDILTLITHKNKCLVYLYDKHTKKYEQNSWYKIKKIA